MCFLCYSDEEFVDKFLQSFRIFLSSFLNFFSIAWVFLLLMDGWIVFLGLSYKRLNCLEVASLAILRNCGKKEIEEFFKHAALHCGHRYQVYDLETWCKRIM